MSIRLRLTLLYSVILALTLIAFSTILYATQAHTSYQSIEADLKRQAERAESLSNPRFIVPSGSGSFGVFTPSAPPSTSFPSGTLPGRWQQTRSLDGAINGQTLDLSGTSLPLSQKGLQTIQSGGTWLETARVQEEPLLVFSKRYTTQTGVVQIVQVASPIGQTEQSLNTLRLILLIGCSAAVIAAFAMGWFLAGLALQPIHRITSTAQAIGAERNFSRRVDHRGPTDEIGQLAITFNNMLAELESGYRHLEGALESQRRFVADASHELRTPLTTVRGNIELLGREPALVPQERSEVLADTTGEVDRLIRLVNQLLVLARADSGLSLHHERIALKPLLEDVYRQAKLIGPSNLTLADDIPDLHLLGDRDALKQVLLILVDNAHVHTTPDTQIELSARLDGDNIAISVSDTGPGIAPDVLPHIFERFYRGEVSRNGRSIGLGLAIAKELVDGQKGTIAVESEVGKGSVFTVRVRVAAS